MNWATREEEDGKISHGWTCGYCPMPARGPPKFRMHINATKALCHVLRLKGNSVSICKGIIPPAKKIQYKALYNAGRVRKREKGVRAAEMGDDIAESQDRFVADHFPNRPSTTLLM